MSHIYLIIRITIVSILISFPSYSHSYNSIRCSINSGLNDDADLKRLVKSIVLKSRNKNGTFFIFSGRGGAVQSHLLLSHFLEINRSNIAAVPVGSVSSAATLLIPRVRDRVAGRFGSFLFHNVTSSCKKDCKIEFDFQDFESLFPNLRKLIQYRNSSIYDNSLMLAQMLDRSATGNAVELLRYHREDRTINAEDALRLGVVRQINSFYDVEMKPKFRCNKI